MDLNDYPEIYKKAHMLSWKGWHIHPEHGVLIIYGKPFGSWPIIRNPFHSSWLWFTLFSKEDITTIKKNQGLL
jgi:hypothetical protein